MDTYTLRITKKGIESRSFDIDGTNEEIFESARKLDMVLEPYFEFTITRKSNEELFLTRADIKSKQ